MSTTRLSLIKTAAASQTERARTDSSIRSSLRVIAEQADMTSQQLTEAVTHILANIAQTSAEGAPLKLMHLNSIAAFMAGVEAIAKALPNAQDPSKVQNTLRYLQASKVGPDGFVTTATAPIAQLGARKQDLMAKYDKMVKDYALSVSRGQANGQELSSAAKQLQQSIDQAMRVATSTVAPQQSPADAGPSTPGVGQSNL